MKPLPLSHRQFKRAGEYKTREEALEGEGKKAERLADARMSAEGIIATIKKERKEHEGNIS
jgi:hypothetical protein